MTRTQRRTANSGLVRAAGAITCFTPRSGRGIGGALILNGKIWHGASGFAGEFGYIAVNSEGCGSRTSLRRTISSGGRARGSIATALLP